MTTIPGANSSTGGVIIKDNKFKHQEEAGYTQDKTGNFSYFIFHDDNNLRVKYNLETNV